MECEDDELSMTQRSRSMQTMLLPIDITTSITVSVECLAILIKPKRETIVAITHL